MKAKFNFQKELTSLMQKQYKIMLSEIVKRGIRNARNENKNI